MRGERLPGVMRGVSPCTECIERHPACHGSCPKYMAWKAEAEKVKNARRAYYEDQEKLYEEEKRRKHWRR